MRYPLSYRQIEEMMQERGVEVDHTTIYRWVQNYSPEIEKRARGYLKPTNDSWRVDETYIKVKGEWKYLYRAVDSFGNTIDFMLSAKRDHKAAVRFFKKALKSTHTQMPRVITVDKNAAYPLALNELKIHDKLNKTTKFKQVKYLNNILEQDHRFIKKLVKPTLGFKSFHTARITLIGYEIMNMIRKGQVQKVEKGDVVGQVKFIADIFGVVA